MNIPLKILRHHFEGTYCWKNIQKLWFVQTFQFQKSCK